MASSFEHINPATEKVWTRPQLFEELETVKAVLASTDEENAVLRRQLAKLLKQRDDITDQLLTSQQYIRDIKLRWQIHQKEASQAIIDVKNLGATTRKVVEPQLVKFASWVDNNSKVFKRA